MVVSFHNGYPLVTPDTGAYIDLGFDFVLFNNDRPAFYGFFLRHTSLWTSLWLTIFAQCLINAVLLIRYIKLIRTDAELGVKDLFLSVIFILVFTGVTWISGYLMPDIFAATLLLGCLLFLHERKSIRWQIGYMAIIIISVSFHTSHFLIFILFSATSVLLTISKNRRHLLRRSLTLLITSLLCFLSLGTAHYLNGHGFTLSKGSHVFVMGKLVETGILKEYLTDNCDHQVLQLCNFKDDLPNVSWAFIWADQGAFQKTGGWDNSKKEYDMIIHDVLTTPKYLVMFLTKSGVSTFRQLTHIQVSGGDQQGKGSSPANAIKHYFDDETGEYLSSQQNSGALDSGFFNKVYLLFFLLSTFIVIQQNKRIFAEPHLLTIYLLVIVFVVINAFITATFANVLDRLQNRIFWMLPATNALLLMKLAPRYFSAPTQKD